MVRYYVRYDERGKLVFVGTVDCGTEITETEYEDLLYEIRTKNELADKLYGGEITIDEVPEEWREEILGQVDERIAEEVAAGKQEISAKEALSIILGGAV